MPSIIRLVTFDALHTIISPRYPIHVQYSQVFAPHVGVLPPEKMKQSFKIALKEVQTEHPSYKQGADKWWSDVIRRTALGAGASEDALVASLPNIVGKLMAQFSSRKGYKAFDDAIPTMQRLHDQLGIRTAVVSNGDTRIRSVLKDLDFPDCLKPIVLSEEEGIEKPSREIFLRALELVNQEGGTSQQPVIRLENCLHIGDELSCDYHGAKAAGFKALLLRREGIEGQHENKEESENLTGVDVVVNLHEIISRVQLYKL
ncbi:HAD-like domain-containing protein [Crassisporium funariophilum]|nr:HAD-like domain-containing protein [Crassisporium funariophilum]